MAAEATFTDRDAVEITLDDGAVVTCYRGNMGPGHGWRAVWLERGGVREKAGGDGSRAVTDEELRAIRAAEGHV